MRLLVAGLAFALIATGTSADEAVIVADEVRYGNRQQSFSAIGNVTVQYEGRTLTASRLDYADGAIKAEGPISFIDGRGTVGIADYAEIDQNFRNAVLEGVQLLLNNSVRMTGARADLRDGQISTVNNSVVTVCRVCTPGERPIWQFRARRVIHDPDTRQLFLQRASFVLGDLKVVSLPYLRLPDPTIERQSGFLFPRLSYSSQRGVWLRAPYFLTLGDHADITLTPGLTSRDRQSLELEFRRAFRQGMLTVEAEALNDNRHRKSLRGHSKVQGNWNLSRGFKLDFRGNRHGCRLS